MSDKFNTANYYDLLCLGNNCIDKLIIRRKARQYIFDTIQTDFKQAGKVIGLLIAKGTVKEMEIKQLKREIQRMCMNKDKPDMTDWDKPQCKTIQGDDL